VQIGIDARLNAYRRGGIPQYTRQLLGALATLAPADEFVVLQHPEHLRPLVVAPNVRRRTIYTPPHHRLEQVTLPVELLPLRLSLLHSPDFIPPLRRSCPAVTTIHDLAFLRFPELLDDAARRYYGQVRQAVHGAEGVIAVSHATRDDIADLLDLDPARVDVIYEAAAPAFQPIQLDPLEARLVNGCALRAGAFILFVSTLEPRKNLPLLLQALRICIDRQPASAVRLVVVGARGWRYESIFDTLATLRLAEHVDFLDSVTQVDLVWLYNACRLFAMPSIYEGFGLPLLEAMACGAPALAANVSSLPEIAGDGALLLPPDDAQAWAEAILSLWKDDHRRVALGARASRRAAEFSWQQAARETLAVYRRLTRNARGHGQPFMPSSSVPAAPLAQATDPDSLEPAIQSVPATSPADQAEPDDTSSLASDLDGDAEVIIRACLRCQAPLAPGELQHSLMLRVDNSPARAPRLWVCPNCGYAEIVVEPYSADEE
jgi:glycosyltransferase involved in cell wall biosynthesis